MFDIIKNYFLYCKYFLIMSTCLVISLFMKKDRETCLQNFSQGSENAEVCVKGGNRPVGMILCFFFWLPGPTHPWAKLRKLPQIVGWCLQHIGHKPDCLHCTKSEPPIAVWICSLMQQNLPVLERTQLVKWLVKPTKLEGGRHGWLFTVSRVSWHL